MKKTIGILGGMGPEATSYMFDLIIKNTDAGKDQEHIPVIICSNPEVPPRTDAILKKGPDPTALLVDGVKKLMAAGADFIIMPCVTAHYFYPAVAAQTKFPLLSLIDESLRWAKENIPGLKRAGIVSSTGTLISRLFHDTFSRAGIDILVPTENEQEQVMEAIFGKNGIKAGCTTGPPKKSIVRIAETLINRGAEAVIAGCTEVPLVLKPEDITKPLIEPMRIAAKAGIIKAGYKVKAE